MTDQQKRKKLSKGIYARFLSEAPVVVVGLGDIEASPKWHVVDVTIALQSMVLAATGEGLGMCWIGSYDEQEVRKLLNVPEKFRVVALLAVGYPREEIDSSAKAVNVIRRRKKLEQIASLEEFGAPFV